MFRGTVDTALIGPGKIAASPNLWDQILEKDANDNGFCTSDNTAEAPTLLYKDSAWELKPASGAKAGCTQMSMSKDKQKDAEPRKITFQGVLTPAAAPNESEATKELNEFKTAAKTFRLGTKYFQKSAGTSGVTNEEVALTESVK